MSNLSGPPSAAVRSKNGRFSAPQSTLIGSGVPTIHHEASQASDSSSIPLVPLDRSDSVGATAIPATDSQASARKKYAQSAGYQATLSALSALVAPSAVPNVADIEDIEVEVEPPFRRKSAKLQPLSSVAPVPTPASSGAVASEFPSLPPASQAHQAPPMASVWASQALPLAAQLSALASASAGTKEAAAPLTNEFEEPPSIAQQLLDAEENRQHSSRSNSGSDSGSSADFYSANVSTITPFANGTAAPVRRSHSKRSDRPNHVAHVARDVEPAPSVRAVHVARDLPFEIRSNAEDIASIAQYPPSPDRDALLEQLLAQSQELCRLLALDGYSTVKSRHSKKSSVTSAPDQGRSGPIERYLVPVSNRYQALRDSVDAKDEALNAVTIARAKHQPSTRVPPKPSRHSEKMLAAHGALDIEERRAVRGSRAVTYEVPSTDSESLPRDANGYVVDEFNAGSDSDPNYVPSSSSRGQSSSRSLSSSTSERNRLSLKHAEFPTLRDHAFFKHSVAPPLRGAIVVDSTIRRRTSRLLNLERTLDEWLSLPSLHVIEADEVESFLEHLQKIEAKYCTRLFDRANSTLPPDFLALLYSCIQAKWPDHATVWSIAAKNVHSHISSTTPATSSCEQLHVPSAYSYSQDVREPRHTATPPHAPSMDGLQELSTHRHVSPPSIRSVYPVANRPVVVPTERPPRISDITDIATLTSSFVYQYRSYERSHITAGVCPMSMFDCLSPQQQRSFSLFCDATLDQLSEESNSRFLERCRQTWGVKSCAGAIDSLSAVRLRGDPLLRTSWVTLQLDFSNVIESVPSSAMPSDAALVKAFLKSCDFEFMASCIRSIMPRTWGEALTQALSLLTDVNFITDARSHRSRKQFGGLAGGSPRPPRREASPPPRDDRRDRADSAIQVYRDDRREGQRHPARDRGEPGGGAAPARDDRRDRVGGTAQVHDHRRDRGAGAALARDNPRRDDRSRRVDFPSAPQSSRPPPSASLCGRCAKPGHNPSECISRHHADGHTLPQLPDAEYAAHKAKYLARRDASANPRVSIINANPSSATWPAPSGIPEISIRVMSSGDDDSDAAADSDACTCRTDDSYDGDQDSFVDFLIALDARDAREASACIHPLLHQSSSRPVASSKFNLSAAKPQAIECPPAWLPGDRGSFLAYIDNLDAKDARQASAVTPQFIAHSAAPLPCHRGDGCHSTASPPQVPWSPPGTKLSPSHKHHSMHRFSPGTMSNALVHSCRLFHYVRKNLSAEPLWSLPSTFWITFAAALADVSPAPSTTMDPTWLRHLVADHLAVNPAVDFAIRNDWYGRDYSPSARPLLTVSGPCVIANGSDLAALVRFDDTFTHPLVIYTLCHLFEVQLVITLSRSRQATYLPYASNSPSIIRQHLKLKAHNGADWSWVRCPVSSQFAAPKALNTRLQASITAECITRRTTMPHLQVMGVWERARAVFRSKAALLNLDHPSIDRMIWERVEFLITSKNTLPLAQPSLSPVSPLSARVFENVVSPAKMGGTVGNPSRSGSARRGALAVNSVSAVHPVSASNSVSAVHPVPTINSVVIGRSPLEATRCGPTQASAHLYDSSTLTHPLVCTITAEDPGTSDVDAPGQDIPTSDCDDCTPSCDWQCSTLVAAVSTRNELLQPPSFFGFIGSSLTAPLPPPPATVLKCDIDTGCSTISVISKHHATRLGLLLRPSHIQATVATGAAIVCKHVTDLVLTVFVNNAWMRFALTAMVWEDLSHDLVLCNAFALDSGLIQFVMPNASRIESFGCICFSYDWPALLSQRTVTMAAIDHEDILSEELDESIDVGDVWLPPSFADLSPSAQHFARIFPNFLQPIPEFADVRLPLWEAFVSEAALVLYSSPAADKALLKPVRTSSKGSDLIRDEFDKLRKLHFIEDAFANPHGVASRVLLVAKPDGTTRVTVNCAQVNKSMQVQAFPLPAVSEILQFVARFPYRVTLDCSKGYHNFEIHPDSRWITRTIGAGLSYQWRKCVQGIASTCAFFQWAMSSLLSDFLFKSCIIYLDDIIVCAETAELCQQYTMSILRVLSDYGIRLNFLKCVFIPSLDAKVLGCIIKGLTVHPSLSVQDTVAQIVHPNSHHTSKKKYTALFHVLGLCAYLDSHCPGLKHAIAPLYVAVSAPVWSWTDEFEAAYGRAIRMLTDLRPYSLPSYAPNSMLELHSDSSDEAWSAVLWERRPDDATDVSSKNLHLLAMYGGHYNARQLRWSTIVKEMFALKEGVERSDHFIRLSPVRCIVDSKVLTYCAITKNPMMQRWHAFIQRYQLTFVHVASELNIAADAISRLLHTYLPSKPSATLRPSTVIVAPISPIVVSSDTSAASPADISIVTRTGTTTVPQPPRPRATTAATPALAASGPSSRRRRGAPAASPPTESTQTSSSSPADSPAQPVRRRKQSSGAPPDPPSTSSSAESPLSEGAMYTHLCTHKTPTDGSCGPSAILEALRSLFHLEADFMQSVPADTQHLRDRVVDSILRIADSPVNTQLPETFRSAIRAEYVIAQRELRDSDFIRSAMEANDDPVQLIHSFIGWAHAMRRPRAYVDEFFIAAAATTFNIQICVVRLFRGSYCPSYFECTDASFRIILFAADDHYEWCSEVNSSTPPLLRRFVLTWTPPALATSPPVPPSLISNPPHLDDSLPIQEGRLRAIAYAHNAVTGHPGRDATLSALRAAGHSWRGMFAEVSKFVDRCPSCQLARRCPPLQAFHRTLRTTDRPCNRWHVDTVGPFPECSGTGFNYFSLFVDEVTGFILLFGNKAKCAFETAAALIQLTGLFGLPDSFHTDGGSEFDSDVLHQFSVLCCVRHTMSIARAPNTNGLAERNVQQAKRALRHLTLSLADFSYWGFLLPIVQRATNFLHRQHLGCCPQQLVFGLSANLDSFVIPCTAAPVTKSLVVDANTHHYAAGIMHAALRFQERTLLRVAELREKQFDAAASCLPAVSGSLQVGDLVLIPWRDDTPPSALHPRMCGPYVVTSLNFNMNTVQLEHSSSPTPPNQLAKTSWSLRAGLHILSDLACPSIDDPASQGLAADSVLPQPIDCILSCSLLSTPLPCFENPSHVSNHLFLVRWLNRPQSSASSVRYDVVKHTVACDRFCLANPFLTGHVSTLHAPASFDPHARPLSERPSHAPVSSAELVQPNVEPLPPFRSPATPPRRSRT
jgi:hypothetical protein